MWVQLCSSELSDLKGAEPGEFGAQPILFLMLYAWWISFSTCTLSGLGHNVGRYVIHLFMLGGDTRGDQITDSARGQTNQVLLRVCAVQVLQILTAVRYVPRPASAQVLDYCHFGNFA